MAPCKSPFRGNRDPRSGFALLIVLSLLGLIVIVLVSLAVYTRVETNIAASAQYEAQARQNAITALNMAIGQLQREAGPDKRVTGTGGLIGANLSQNPYWTGVWDTSAGGASASRGFQSWLVNPANGALTTSALAGAAKSVLTTSTNGSNAAGDDGVVQLVGDGDLTVVPDGSVVSSPPLGEPGNGGPANAQFITLKLDKLSTSGLPGFAATDYRTFGRIAWWTSDDGVKASLSGVSRVSDVNYADASGDDYAGGAITIEGYVKRERLTAMNLQSPRTDLALRNFAVTDPLVTQLNADIFGAMLHPASKQYVQRVDSIRQYTGAIRAVGPTNALFVAPTLSPNTTRNNYQRMDQRLRERFHDIAPANFSVLSDVVRSGLKTDFDAFTTAILPANQQQIGRFKAARISAENSGTALGLVQSRIKLAELLPPPSTLFSIAPGVPGPLNQPIAVIGPSMTESQFSLRFQQTAAGEVNVIFQGNVELWNPYNAVMECPNSATDRWVLRVLVWDNAGERFSDIALSDSTKVTASSLNIARTLGISGPSNYDFELDIPAANSLLAPGQAKTWPLVSKTFTAKDASGVNLTGYDPAATPVSVNVGGPTVMTATLLRVRTAPSATTEEYFGMIDVNFAASGGAAPTSGVSFYSRLKDQNDFTGATDWLEAYDPRGPRVVGGGTNAITVIGTDPADAYQNYSAFDSGGELIKSATSPGARSVVIADLPRQQITSVGYLQQMPHSSNSASTNSPAYRIGSANGSSFNSLYDSHYFSTVPRGATAWDPSTPTPLALPNTSLVVVNRLAGPPSLADLQGSNVDTARYFLARDTLNVNSVSVTAWRSVLGGLLPGFSLNWDSSGGNPEEKLQGGWRYVDGGGALATANVGNAFFRLPQTGADVRANPATVLGDLGSAAAGTRVPASFRMGVRSLTNAQVNALASAVVTRIAGGTGRGAPFRSLQEFVDSNILQLAIGDANINGTGATLLDTFATGFLTQGDILQGIGHRLTARSDTFTIRAYGEAGSAALDANDANFVKGRAWVEATVQRMPMKHSTSLNPTDDMTDTGDTAGTHLGREFRIISFRWLTPNDL